MGRSLARQMVARGDRVVLLGRNAEELERSAQDLASLTAADPQTGSSSAAAVATVPCDLEQPEGFDRALDAATAALGDLDTVVVTAGVFAPQDRLEEDPALTERLLRVDFANTVLFCEAARKRLLARPPVDGRRGTLCVFSSVAGERGRKPVVIYGAAKAGLSTYLEGLDHRFRRQGLVTVCVKPGFVRTGMTAGLPVPPFAGDPDEVAATVLAGIDAGRPVVWAPPIWRLVLFVIKLLPRAVMRRISI